MDKLNIINMINLKEGESFRYRGSDESQKCLVTRIDKANKWLYYNSGNTHVEERASLSYPINVIFIPEVEKESLPQG